MPVEARRAIVNYLELLKGGKEMARKVTTFGQTLHPHLARSLIPCATHFANTMLNKMGILDSEEEWSKVLAVIPDENIRKELQKDWSEKTDLTSKQRWEMLQSKLRQSKVHISLTVRDHTWNKFQEISYFNTLTQDLIRLSLLG